MVAVAEEASLAGVRRRRGLVWEAGAAAVLVVGLGVRLAVGGGGVGDRSAVVMEGMLCLGAWLAALLLTSRFKAFLVVLSLVALLDLAALPPRNAPEYDSFTAFFATDQTLAVTVPMTPGLAQPTLRVLVQPVFASSEAQPRFGLAGQIDGTPLSWQCQFKRGIQRIALPVPAGVLQTPGASQTADVRLHLTGTPSDEGGEYLLVYESSKQGGFLVSLASASRTAQDTPCALA